MDNYSYPIDDNWTTEEMITVVEFLNLIEEAYEVGTNSEKILEGYKKFKQAIPSIGEERQIGRKFEEISGYSLYHTVKAAKESNRKKIKMNRK